MAAFLGLANTAEVALTAATAKTVLQLVAAANHRIQVLEWWCAFDGTSTTAEPVLVEIVRQSDAGTTSALTPVKLDDSLSETLQTTARHTATAEPTTGDVLKRIEVHPQQGFNQEFALGAEIICGGGDRIGWRFTAPANVNVVAGAKFCE